MSSTSLSDSVSTQSTPHLRFQPLRTPLLESSLLPSKPLDVDSPSCHTHIHIHSHYPADSASSSSKWTLSSSPSASPFSLRFSSFSRSATPQAGCLCTTSVLVKLFVILCLLLALLVYHTHLCLLADTNPDSPLSLLHSSLPTSLHQHHSHEWPSDSSQPLLTLAQLSAVQQSAPASSHSSDYLLDPWQSRLLPVAVEMEQSVAWLTLNLMLLTGYAHAPPVYDGAVCVMLENSTECVDSRLHIQWNEQYIVRVTTSVSASPQPTQRNAKLAPLPPTPPFVQEWLWLSHGHIDHMLTQSPANVIVSAATANRTAAPTLLSAASALATAIMPTVARVRVVDLVPSFTYTFTVSLSNGTHYTRPLASLPSLALDQRSLFARERQRISRYLNLVTDTAANPPPPLSPPLPFRHPVPVSPTRVAAPFEAAGQSQHCPAAFQRWVSDYRAFHADAVERLMAARGDVSRLYHLINGTRDDTARNGSARGIRLLVSGVYRWSGVTDRTSAFTGLYLVAMLTRRVLLLDEDWPDIQRVLLSPLTLPFDVVVPQLRHAALHNLTQFVPVTDIGPETDEYEAHYSGQVVLITSIKGIIMRLLTESPTYSPLLQSLGLTPDNVVGCIAHSLWHVRLSSLLYYQHYQSALLPLLSPSTAAIGIQIRSWHDYVFLSQANQTKAGTYTAHDDIAVEGVGSAAARHSGVIARFGDQGFFHCAQDITDTLALNHSSADSASAQLKQPVWYLVSDDESMRAAAIARWGLHDGASPSGRPYVLTLLSAQLLGHSNSVDLDLGFLFLRHAVVEQFLFSLCAHHVVSLASGYGRWPALLALRHRRVYVVANDQQNVTRKAASTCMDEERDGMGFAELGAVWSKV